MCSYELESQNMFQSSRASLTDDVLYIRKKKSLPDTAESVDWFLFFFEVLLKYIFFLAFKFTSDSYYSESCYIKLCYIFFPKDSNTV